MSELLSVYDENYFRGDRELSKRRIERTLDLLGDVRGKYILDLGAGTGEGSAMLRGRGAVVTCLDVAPYALQCCHGLKFDGVIALGHALPFASQSFDGVLFMDVIEHLSKDASMKTLKEIKRITRRGGMVAIHTMPTLFLEKMSQIYGVFNRSHWRRCGTQGGHINTYTSWRLRREIERSGLTIVKYEIGRYPQGAPFYEILHPASRILRQILGNDLWVYCTT